MSRFVNLSKLSRAQDFLKFVDLVYVLHLFEAFTVLDIKESFVINDKWLLVVCLVVDL